MLRSLFAVQVTAFFFIGMQSVSAQHQLSVAIDTTGLISQPGPYYLLFQLVRNNHTGGTSEANRVVLEHFDFGSGDHGSLPPQTLGSVQGDLRDSTPVITMESLGILNYFVQDFQPGSEIVFTLRISTTSSKRGPDSFAVAILGSDKLPLPTLGAVDQVLQIDLSLESPLLETKASDPARTSIIILPNAAFIPNCDTTGDLQVDALDFNMIVASGCMMGPGIAGTSPACNACDVDRDFDLGDFAILQREFGQ